MSSRLTVSVVIPNWNGEKLLQKNLPIVLSAAANKKNKISEVIVVDDCSTDRSVSILESKFKDKVTIIRHTKNRGFAATANRGVRNANCELVCLLNTDVIPENNFLETCIPLFKDKLVFGVTLHERGYGPAIGKFENGYIAHESGSESNDLQNTFWISGGSGLFRKSAWKKLKGLDEKLYSPFYWEDVDLGYRAWKRGYKLYWDPSAKVIHKHESVINTDSFKKRKLDFIKERNHLLFNWKNITSKTLLNKHAEAVIKRIQNHPGYTKVVLASLLRLPTLLKRRKSEELEAKLSDEAVFELFRL